MQGNVKFLLKNLLKEALVELLEDVVEQQHADETDEIIANKFAANVNYTPVSTMKECLEKQKTEPGEALPFGFNAKRARELAGLDPYPVKNPIVETPSPDLSRPVAIFKELRERDKKELEKKTSAEIRIKREYLAEIDLYLRLARELGSKGPQFFKDKWEDIKGMYSEYANSKELDEPRGLDTFEVLVESDEQLEELFNNSLKD